jgi:uncharacterized protein (DUF433 family)
VSYKRRQSRPGEAKKQFNARLSPRTLEHLRSRSNQVNVPAGVLAERYVEEGLRMDEHPLIHFREGAAGRRPALVGTRLDVWQVIETVRQNSNSLSEAADYLQIPLSHVEACVAYYVAYQDEVDEWTGRERDAAEQAESSWRRRQEIFT